MRMQIYLFRHGQTAGNAAGKYVGNMDEPLCALGMDTARAAGSDPAVREVVVSPLRRTQMTAAILFPNAKQQIAFGLREMDFGDFEGRSAREMEHDPEYRYWVERTACMGPCPHGDATLVFGHRVRTAFLQEVGRAQAEGRDRLYFVIHGGAIMSIMHGLAAVKAPYYSWLLKNCQGYRCKAEMTPEGLRLVDVMRLEKVES